MPRSRDSRSLRPSAVPLAALSACADRIPAALPPGGRGWCATMAGVLEATAPKPGNVHPGASFDDLTYDELVAAATAIGPVFEQAAAAPLGRTILRAVQAAAAVTRSNANLGIILAIAPLAAAPAGERLSGGVPGPLTAADAGDVWAAIAAARPGGMGTADRLDLAGPAPDDLLAAMRLAAPRDQIAALWVDGYGPLHDGLVHDLADGFTSGLPWTDAIVRGFLRQLARAPDSLIARKHGRAVAVDVSTRAAAVLAAPAAAWRDRVAAFDRALRTPVRINPGTTADLVAAALYILLRSHAE